MIFVYYQYSSSTIIFTMHFHGGVRGCSVTCASHSDYFLMFQVATKTSKQCIQFYYFWKKVTKDYKSLYLRSWSPDTNKVRRREYCFMRWGRDGEEMGKNGEEMGKRWGKDGEGMGRNGKECGREWEEMGKALAITVLSR